MSVGGFTVRSARDKRRALILQGVHARVLVPHDAFSLARHFELLPLAQEGVALRARGRRGEALRVLLLVLGLHIRVGTAVHPQALGADDDGARLRRLFPLSLPPHSLFQPSVNGRFHPPQNRRKTQQMSRHLLRDI